MQTLLGLVTQAQRLNQPPIKAFGEDSALGFGRQKHLMGTDEMKGSVFL